MSKRTAGLVAALASFLAAGCNLLWGKTGYSCEEIFTCDLEDAGADAFVASEPDSSRVERAESDAIPDRTADSSIIGDAGTSDGSPDGPEDASRSSLEDADADEAGCDGSSSPLEAPCTIDEQFGVFVSPRANDASDGTRAHPYSSIAAALHRATADRKRVYVCDDGTGYAESLTIDGVLDGLQIFGGFECSTWIYSVSQRARLTAPASPVLTIARLSKGIMLEGIDVVAPDGATPGASSVAIVVQDSTGVVLRRVKAIAGKGRGGSNGDNGGGASNDPAPTGAKGNDGQRACLANPNFGGATAISVCGGVEASNGGRGGEGAAGLAGLGGDGAAGSPTAAAGRGGAGEPTAGTWDCSTGNGQAGTNGEDGSPGGNGTGLGALSVSGWIGVPGADGNSGKPGQGGGGGGGARAPYSCVALDGGAGSLTGASGGSGGGGGCGGNAGKGGTAGGSSIALVSINSGLTLDVCELVAADGGNGGNGGLGQRGGNGGDPGKGGDGVGTSKTACDGDRGGQGGNGGPGGGGVGGHSLGVAYLGNAPAGLELAAVQIGKSGTGGQPGSGVTGKGSDGVAASSRAFDAPDAGP